jgi:enoyl-CoA hydratase
MLVQPHILRELFHAVRHCEIPVIAAIDGAALGLGCILAANCDIRVASHKARFALPEIDVGRCGGGAHLGRLISQGNLRRMVFSAEPLSADQAERIGLVDILVTSGELKDAAFGLASRIASKVHLDSGFPRRL